MQFRPDAGSGPGLSFRRPAPGSPFPASSLRGTPVDYGRSVDDRRYTVQAPSWLQQEPLPPNSSQGDHQEEAPPSRHLWVGKVSQEVRECLSVEKFTKFGSIESVTVYSQRNYAFVNFKNLENARDAKNGLQGLVLGALAMRIEFSKGVKPNRQLWVGGIGQAVSREAIEGEFKRFGIMEDFKFLRDRNCAFVDYEKIEDAIAAVDSLNSKFQGDEELRVDFGRSQPIKPEAGGRPGPATPHEEWGGANPRDTRDHPDHLRSIAEPHRYHSDARQSERGSSCGRFRGPSDVYQAGSGPGSVAMASGKIRGEKEEPSDVLWVGFPLLSKVDEDGLRRAFVPYGEVERVKTFPGRTYAFVQFKNVDEASRAKVALEGKLFNDPRVHIRYSNSEVGPVDTPRVDGNSFFLSQGKDAPGFSEKHIGRVAISDRFVSAAPLRSTGLRPEYFPGGLARGAALPRSLGAGAVISLGCGIGLGPSGPEARIPPDETDYQTGVRGLPGPGARHPCGEQLGFRDDESVAREAKRPRTVHGDLVDPFFHSHYQGGRRYSGSESIGLGLDSGRESYGLSLSRNIGTGDEYSQVPGLPRVRPRSLQFERSTNVGGVQGQSAASLRDPPAVGFPGAGKRESFGSVSAVLGVNEGWRWHGTIAKGGTPVCRARCLSVGKSIDAAIPDVVNCTARTDLDMLAKHVHQAGDFGVVFFVPEADPDVPPYHDFMHYLGEKHRAGVAKLIDGTTLFLVPPSEFSEKVLKVQGNNCLFGVVLKAQQPSPVDHALFQQLQPHAPAPQQLHLPPQLVHPPLQHTVSQQQQTSHPQGMFFVNGHSTRENSALPAPPLQKVSSPAPTAASSTLTQSQLTSLAGRLPTVLTPELIASLTALLPSQSQPSALPGPPRLLGTSMQPGSLREGKGLGGLAVRIAPNSGSAVPVPAAVDNRSLHRPSQSHQLAVLQSQSWPSAQSGHEVGIGGHVSVPPEQESGYAPPPQKQSQVSPSVAIAQPHPGSSPSLIQHAYLAAQGQGFQGSGYSGQQAGQHYRAPQHPMQLGGAHLLPSEQLAQLTVLLTQRQEQSTQQQQAAELLQQHYQQQHSPLTPLPQQHQQPVPLPLPQSQARSCVQQSHHQQQLYAPHASTQQQCVHSGPLPQHLSQPLAQLHVVGSGWDGATATEGQQQRPAPPPTIVQPQVSLPQQLLPTGGTIGDKVGGASQDDTERQKRFQATLQLAAALLQQMQHQQNPGQGNPEQR